ncbi:MAG: DUF3987 domain-containing protein [Candidatus Dormibacteria bacterium]
MPRNFTDWLPNFLTYADVVEAPRVMHFWSGVSAISGALRKKVWIDMRRFRWVPNFFIIFVAKPGIIAKSTTAGIAMDLLREVPGIKFGPDIGTWQAIIPAFNDASESFEYDGEWIPMSPLTFVASELGNLINMADREAINLFIDLWDGRKTFDKITKQNGNDTLEGPWVNIIGCTTPDWISTNMSASTIAGGFASRCIFVFADKKVRFVPYVDEAIGDADDSRRLALIADLEYISTNLCGPYQLSDGARIWGRDWYEKLWTQRPEALEDGRMDGYVARRQTHLHKLAMIIAASRSDRLVITEEELMLANEMLRTTETDLLQVFTSVGKSETAVQFDRFLAHLRIHQIIPYEKAYRFIQSSFPDFRDFEGVLNGAIRAGLVAMAQQGGMICLKWTGDVAISPSGNMNINPLDLSFKE